MLILIYKVFPFIIYKNKFKKLLLKVIDYKILGEDINF